MPTVAANGLEIGYDVEGAGPPLVVLHGATTSGRLDLGELVAGLAVEFRLYLPDARGHGRTRWDAADGFRWDWLVDDVVAFADALGLSTFHLMGSSMGGMTALQLAAARPARLRSLVVVGISPEREPRASIAKRMFDPDRIAATDPTWAADLAARHDRDGAGAWRRLLPAIAADVAAQPLMTPAELRTIDAPALVAVGDRDPFVPLDQAVALKRQLGDGRLFVAPDAGHALAHERPALFLEALSAFYRSTEDVARTRAKDLQTEATR
jgi:pimeloyl-ACP methyl ester carboxylesterase